MTVSSVVNTHRSIDANNLLGILDKSGTQIDVSSPIDRILFAGSFFLNIDNLRKNNITTEEKKDRKEYSYG